MIAITGAAGFIGSNLAHRLAIDGHDLLLVDHPLTASKTANLLGLRQFRFCEADLFPNLLSRERPNLKGLFHLGACSRTTETDWAYLLRNNVEYSQQLWRWCADSGCPLIYASSAATYGDGSLGFSDRIPPDELRPLNLYGRSKNDFDLWALEQIEAGEPAPIRWVGMKFFNVYGPHESHKTNMASVVWQAFRQVRANGIVRLFRSSDPAYPDGEQLRDFVFVGDCVRHMIWLWRTPTPNGLYNSGTGIARTFSDLAWNVAVHLGREPHVEFIDMPTELAQQYQNFTEADMSKWHEVGYDRPPTTLEDGVKHAVAGYLAAKV